MAITNVPAPALPRVAARFIDLHSDQIICALTARVHGVRLMPSRDYLVLSSGLLSMFEPREVSATMAKASTATVYTRYPLHSVLLYEGATILHFALGALGIALGYGAPWGYGFAGLYFAGAFAGMYVLMPLKVCPNCVYYSLKGSRCVSALNLVSRKLAPAGDPEKFASRANGVLCPNTIYMASLILPVVAMIPALIVNFSLALLALCLVVVALLLFRFFFMFKRVACGHCRAKSVCPNAIAMGLSKD